MRLLNRLFILLFRVLPPYSRLPRVLYLRFLEDLLLLNVLPIIYIYYFNYLIFIYDRLL